MRWGAINNLLLYYYYYVCTFYNSFYWLTFQSPSALANADVIYLRMNEIVLTQNLTRRNTIATATITTDHRRHQEHKYSRAQELCESRGGRPGLPSLISLMVSVDVKQHFNQQIFPISTDSWAVPMAVLSNHSERNCRRCMRLLWKTTQWDSNVNELLNET